MACWDQDKKENFKIRGYCGLGLEDDVATKKILTFLKKEFKRKTNMKFDEATFQQIGNEASFYDYPIT